MKRLLVFNFLFVLMCSVGYSQVNNVQSDKILKQLTADYDQNSNGVTSISTEGISTKTAFLLLDMNAKINENELVEKYNLIHKNGKLYASSFILGTAKLNKEHLYKMDVLPNSQAGNIHTALIPVEKIRQVAEHTEITYVQIGEKVYQLMDSARKATNVDKVHQATAPLTSPYTGKGVVVGILDGGFDFTHPNFYDSTGMNNYRIKRVWVQHDNTGTPPTGYNFGTEHTSMTTMINAQTDIPAGSHGSHVAGIATGSGGFPNSPHRGVAPESDIVMVSIGGINTELADAITYIHDYASSEDKPSVINMSLGTHEGPHDGSSLFDQFCDNAVGPGRLLVGAAGNEGSDRLYMSRNFSNTDTMLNSILVDPYQTLFATEAGIDAWASRATNFMVRISLYNDSTQSIEDATQFISTSSSAAIIDTLWGSNNIPVLVQMASEVNAVNSKPHIGVKFDNTLQPNLTRRILVTVIGKNTNLQMWTTDNPPRWFIGNPIIPASYTGETSHTVGEIGGTGNSVISVGSYCTENSLTDIDGNNHSISNTLLDISGFSSKGPTADGRTKPEITAPGQYVLSSQNSFLPQIDRTEVGDSIIVNNKTYYFNYSQGTSMAAPVVTGILALWLQKYPDLTIEQAIALMKSNAITDNFTGSIPTLGSNTWGWGKIDAFAGLNELINNIPPKPTYNPPIYCEGVKNILSASAGHNGYEWSTGDTTQNITESDYGSYAFRVRNQKGYYSPWSDSATIHELPDANIISFFNNVLTSSPAQTYQWYNNGNIIIGANMQTYMVITTGSYQVEVTDNNGCTNMSEPMQIVPNDIQQLSNTQDINISPNPATNNILVEGVSNATYTITDVSGRKLKSGVINSANNNISLSGIQSGIYFLHINEEGREQVVKFMKQ